MAAFESIVRFKPPIDYPVPVLFFSVFFFFNELKRHSFTDTNIKLRSFTTSSFSGVSGPVQAQTTALG